MYKVKIISIGKTKESWLDEAILDYSSRMRGTLSIEIICLKTNEQLVEALAKESRVIAMDPKGKPLSSEHFSKLLIKELEKGGSKLSFAIGGADGLPEIIRNQYPLISLSALTFTHQITRLILIEQIYRGLEIAKGSPYHK